MNDQDLASAVRHSAPEVTAPAFDKAWANAEMSHRQARRRYAWLASAAATVAAMVIVLNIGPLPENTINFIELADLMGSTSWIAPSDSLLPEHQFDLYQDLPTLIESTKPAEGALL
jgi:hypothetical protein